MEPAQELGPEAAHSAAKLRPPQKEPTIQSRSSTILTIILDIYIYIFVLICELPTQALPKLFASKFGACMCAYV